MLSFWFAPLDVGYQQKVASASMELSPLPKKRPLGDKTSTKERNSFGAGMRARRAVSPRSAACGRLGSGYQQCLRASWLRAICGGVVQLVRTPLRFTQSRAIPSISPLPALLRLVTDSDYLTGLEGFQMLKACWNPQNEVFQKNRSPAENNDCDLPITQVLLVFKATIYG